MKLRKILVCIHIYYHNQVDYIIDKLKSLNGIDYDLFVTYTNENKETNEKFLNFNKNAKFKIVENKGYDIYPFLVLINEIDLEKYSSVLKLHTKNKDEFDSYSWRDDLYENLMGTKNIFKANLKKIEKYGLVGSKKRITTMNERCPENVWLFEDVCKQIGIEPKKVNFIAGTIFLARIEIIKRIKELNLLQLDFENKTMETGSNGTVAHVIERLFGVLCNDLGYKIYGSNKRKIFSKEWKNNILRKIFSIQNKNCKKFYTIFGITISKNRYEYEIKGLDNNIYITKNNERKFLKEKAINGLEIIIKGNGNTIKIAKNASFENSKLIIISNTNEIIIEDNVKLKNCTFVLKENENKLLKITKNTSLEDKEIVLKNINEECIIWWEKDIAFLQATVKKIKLAMIFYFI